MKRLSLIFKSSGLNGADAKMHKLPAATKKTAIAQY
jgi:hypothetical protein